MAAVLEKIPDGQEILLISDLSDHLQLGVELRAVVRGLGPVALGKSPHGEACKKLAGCASLGRIKAGKGEFAESKREAAFLSDPLFIPKCIWNEDGVLRFAGVRLIQQSKGAYAFYNA